MFGVLVRFGAPLWDRAGDPGPRDPVPPVPWGCRCLHRTRSGGLTTLPPPGRFAKPPRTLGVWFPRGQWGGSPPCARRSWLVMMTPKPCSVFTKGVRTLVPRLTHALTLPVSDVFGLHHYALSLGGRSPRPEWVVRTVPGEGRRVTCLLKSLLGGRTGVPSARSVIPWTLSNHPRTCGLQTRRPGATLLCTRPLHCAQIDRRPLGPSREAGLPVPGASGKK